MLAARAVTDDANGLPNTYTPSGCRAPLTVCGPRSSRPNQPFDQPGRVLGQIGPTRLRHGLHPLGQTHGVTQRRRVQHDVVTDAAHDHLTRIDPNTNLEVDILITAQLFRVRGDRPGDVPGGMARPSGVVLLSERSAEQSHDPIAGELVDRSPEAAHPLGQDGDQTTHDPRPPLGIEMLLHVHRPQHVGEQHRQLLALAHLTDRHPPRNSRRHRASDRCERCPALAAEPFTGLIGRPTRRTDRSSQRPTALRAEPATLPILGPTRRTDGAHVTWRRQTPQRPSRCRRCPQHRAS